jgi:CubicO group peptidase (beta-lactamase class C family)
VISGQPFDEYLRTTLFEPLGMHDTGFTVPDDKIDRFAAVYRRGRGKVLTLAEDPYASRFRTPPAMLSGGGGLVSTTADYLRFCQMLLNGGELNGVRILKANTVRQMTTDTLPPGTRFAGVQGDFVGPPVGTSWGLGFAVRTNPDFSLLPGSVGSFNWSGYWGTYFWIDPAEKLIGLQMIQVAPEANEGQYRNALRHLAYAALSVPEPAAASDPATPPANGKQVVRHLKRGRLVVVPNRGHGVVGVEGSECVVGVIDQFIDAGSADKLDTACIERMPPIPFLLDTAP